MIMYHVFFFLLSQIVVLNSTFVINDEKFKLIIYFEAYIHLKQEYVYIHVP